MNGRCLVLGMLLTATGAAGANEPLALRVSPAFSFAPANLVIQAKVDPDADNRSMEVIADPPNSTARAPLRSKASALPRRADSSFAACRLVSYQITATLVGADGRQRAIARQQVKVLESGAAR